MTLPKFKGNGWIGAPAHGVEVVDVSSVDQTFDPAMVALYVGTSGNVKVDTEDSTGVTFTNLQDGTILPAFITKIYNVGTTATNMVALHAKDNT